MYILPTLHPYFEQVSRPALPLPHPRAHNEVLCSSGAFSSMTSALGVGGRESRSTSRCSSPGPHGKEDAPLLTNAAPSKSFIPPPSPTLSDSFSRVKSSRRTPFVRSYPPCPSCPIIQLLILFLQPPFNSTQSLALQYLTLFLSFTIPAVGTPHRCLLQLSLFIKSCILYSKFHYGTAF